MGYVDIQCPACGHQASVTEEAAARMTRCAACGEALSKAETVAAAEPATARRLRLRDRLPAQGDPSAADPKPTLRLNPAGAVGGNMRLCPHCHAVMEQDAIICSFCGYNTHTGRFVQEEHARRQRLRRGLATLAIVLILTALTGAAWRRGWIRLPDWRAWVAPPPADEAPPPSAPRALGEEEIAALAADLEPAVRAEWDQRAPLVRKAAAVEIELLTGEVIHGTFWGTKASRIALIMVEGVLREVPHDQMRPAYRLRFDAPYRDEAIRAEARRRAETFRSR